MHNLSMELFPKIFSSCFPLCFIPGREMEGVSIIQERIPKLLSADPMPKESLDRLIDEYIDEIFMDMILKRISFEPVR